MTEATFNKRAKQAGMTKNSIAYKELFALLSGEKDTSRPDISGKRQKQVYTGDMLYYTAKMNICIVRKNDSPRGGVTGNYCFLSSKGKRQMFKK